MSGTDELVAQVQALEVPPGAIIVLRNVNVGDDAVAGDLVCEHFLGQGRTDVLVVALDGDEADLSVIDRSAVAELVGLHRYALLAGDIWSTAAWSHNHYRGTFATVEAAIEALPAPHEVADGWGCGYARVLDLMTGVLVAARRSTYGPPGESVWIDGDGEVG